MKSRFQRIYDIIMEQVGNAPTEGDFQYQNMTLAVVPGSFKPPHKGHWEMVMHYVDMVNDDVTGKKTPAGNPVKGKVIVLISNISTKAISERFMSGTHLKDLQSIKTLADKAGIANVSAKADELYQKGINTNEGATGITYNELKADLENMLQLPELAEPAGDKVKKRIEQYEAKLEKNLFTSIRKDANGREITPEMSKEIFEIFAKRYGVQNIVDVQVSQSASPISATNGLINNACKNCKIFLGVSTKGGDDKERFNFINASEENQTNEIIPAPVDVNTMLSATELRNGINDLKKEWFPDKLSNSDFNKIKDILNRG